MSGAKHRLKGSRVERRIVHLHEEMEIEAERIPLSGAAGGSFAGDVRVNVPWLSRNLLGEVKARKNGAGFATLERWLADYDLLFLVRDRAEPMVTMPWKTYHKLLALSHYGEQKMRIAHLEERITALQSQNDYYRERYGEYPISA